MYSSRDLCNWKNEGIIMHESDDPDDPFYPNNIMDRPHIIYCEKTGKYQMWSKCTGKDFNAAFFAICESECVTGPNGTSRFDWSRMAILHGTRQKYSVK